uniref:Uncharacterized protein n=1 Tax=Bartonella schoenbuchensis (strain DSM 13525 / NCTC 13165 / R1) TaxID=687861 RepID=E6YYH4_BARSR|nr:hypothetical protein B11C_20262 [Bartonella schoenbuchensis R1]
MSFANHSIQFISLCHQTDVEIHWLSNVYIISLYDYLKMLG